MTSKFQLMKGFANMRPANYIVPPRWSVYKVIQFIAGPPIDWHHINLTLITWILAISLP